LISEEKKIRLLRAERYIRKSKTTPFERTEQIRTKHIDPFLTQGTEMKYALFF